MSIESVGGGNERVNAVKSVYISPENLSRWKSASSNNSQDQDLVALLRDRPETSTRPKNGIQAIVNLLVSLGIVSAEQAGNLIETVMDARVTISETASAMQEKPHMPRVQTGRDGQERVVVANPERGTWEAIHAPGPLATTGGPGGNDNNNNNNKVGTGGNDDSDETNPDEGAGDEVDPSESMNNSPRAQGAQDRWARVAVKWILASGTAWEDVLEFLVVVDNLGDKISADNWVRITAASLERLPEPIAHIRQEAILDAIFFGLEQPDGAYHQLLVEERVELLREMGILTYISEGAFNQVYAIRGTNKVLRIGLISHGPIPQDAGEHLSSMPHSSNGEWAGMRAAAKLGLGPQIDEVRSILIPGEGRFAGFGAIIMDEVDGSPLREFLFDPDPLVRMQITGRIEELIGVYAEFAAYGWTQGDIGPSNIMLTEDGFKLIDFGFVRQLPPDMNKVLRLVYSVWVQIVSRAKPENVTSREWFDLFRTAFIEKTKVTNTQSELYDDRLKATIDAFSELESSLVELNRL